MNKWLRKSESYVEYWAKFLVMIFGIALAIFTVISILPILPEDDQLRLLIFLILFMVAASIVFLFETRHLFRKQPIIKQEGTEIPEHLGHISRNKWITIGAVVLAAIVIGLIFVARQLPPTTQGYQTFFMALAATGAWVTGIALVVFTYQQYKLRQTEHRLLFEPQILLKPAGTPITGELTYKNQKYPYRIEWTVLIHNTSQQPILIEFMSLRIIQRGWGKATDKEGYLNIPSYHILEPDGLKPPFQVTQTTPQQIRWIIEGINAGLDLDDAFGDSNNRNFQHIFYVQAINPQDPSKSIFPGIISNSFRIPKDAPWGGKITKLT